MKALYDLKQSSCVWYKHLHKHFKAVRLIVSPYDPSVFVNKGDSVNIIIAIHVNDLLVCGHSMNQINNILKHLQSEFEMTNLSEIINYLGMEIDIETDSIMIHQTAYIYDMLQYFKM